jgi:hypothetical protein
MIIDMSLHNKTLYAGCAIKEEGGKLILATPAGEAANIVKQNAFALIAGVADRSSVTLKGTMDMGIYLVVFHVVVNEFNEVWYEDDQGTKTLVAHPKE